MKSIFLNKISNIVSRFSSTVSELFSVIRGPRPANLDCRISSGNDGHRGRLFSSCKFFNYPSPADKSATSPARGEVLNNITFKGLDVVRQYAALLERRVQSSTRVRKAQVVTRQTKHIRNLLPQCASDATGFLSDVYKKSTRAQKFLADGVQYGRSMIEMLGVLAIIGVLSVGGIAGYSKAMTKWKINQTIEQIEQITHNTFTAYVNQKEMDDICTYGRSGEKAINLLKSLSIISEDMIVDGQLKNSFGGKLHISIPLNEYEHHINEKSINIEYYNIPREACMALGSLDWAKGSDTVIGIQISPDGDINLYPSDCWFNAPFPDYDHKWLIVCNNRIIDEEYGETEDDITPLPIPFDIVAEHCNCKDNDCYFGVAFTDR